MPLILFHIRLDDQPVFLSLLLHKGFGYLRKGIFVEYLMVIVFCIRRAGVVVAIPVQPATTSQRHHLKLIAAKLSPPKNVSRLTTGATTDILGDHDCEAADRAHISWVVLDFSVNILPGAIEYYV